jgi:hypothetical protein
MRKPRRGCSYAGEEYAAMEGGVPYASVQAAVAESANIVSDPPQVPDAFAIVAVDGDLAGASPVRACGVERWAVKTLTDPAARLVDFRARRTTVAALRQLRPPRTHGRRLRRVETTVYRVRVRVRVRVRLLAVKLEDDQDIHLVIADPATGGTMTAESPGSACTKGAAPAVRPDDGARQGEHHPSERNPAVALFLGGGYLYGSRPFVKNRSSFYALPD